jgi:magnesium transporter
MVWDVIDNARDAVSNTFDVYMSTVSTNMDKVIKALTVVATITLPFMVLSSIYGTNFYNLPGATSPYGFWVMISVMVLMAAIMMYSFKKRKWF